MESDVEVDETAKKQAIARGIDFIFFLSGDEKNIYQFGNDLIQFFYDISLYAQEPQKQSSLLYVEQISQKWKLLVEKKGWKSDIIPNSQEYTDAVVGLYCLDRLGTPSNLRDELIPYCEEKPPECQYYKRGVFMGVKNILGWNPLKGELPNNRYDKCPKCNNFSPKANNFCKNCQSPLAIMNKYRILSNALIYSFFFSKTGVLPKGMHYPDIFRYIRDFHPFLPPKLLKENEFIDQCYLVTHIIFTLNNWGELKLDSLLLPNEYFFLKEYLPYIVEIGDVHLAGEFLEALNSFGESESDLIIKNAMNFLISKQNNRGGWDENGDEYTQYHATMVACQGLLFSEKKGWGPSFPELMTFLNELLEEDKKRCLIRNKRCIEGGIVVEDESWEVFHGIIQETFHFVLRDPYFTPEEEDVSKLMLCYNEDSDEQEEPEEEIPVNDTSLETFQNFSIETMMDVMRQQLS